MLIWHDFVPGEKAVCFADKEFTSVFKYHLVVEQISEHLYEWRIRTEKGLRRSGYAKTLENAKELAEFHTANLHWYNEAQPACWSRDSAWNGFIYVIWTDFGYKFALREQDKWWISDDWQIEYNLKVYSFIMLPADPNGK